MRREPTAVKNYHTLFTQPVFFKFVVHKIRRSRCDEEINLDKLQENTSTISDLALSHIRPFLNKTVTHILLYSNILNKFFYEVGSIYRSKN